MVHVSANKTAEARPHHVLVREPSSRQVLITLYALTSFLCGMMVVWILVFPASWMLGHVKGWERFVLDVINNATMQRFGTTASEYHVVPPSVATKYAGHTAVQFTHILPAAFWAAAIPFQLNPSFRKNHRLLHRRIGYAFMAVTLLMSIGVVLILMRGLFYENFFPDLPRSSYTSGPPFLMLLSLWFVCTAFMAVLKARQHDFQAHQRYIVRHVGSGMWVALQRLMLMTMYHHPPFTQLEQRENFGNAAMIAIFVSLVSAEWAIVELNKQPIRFKSTNKCRI